MFSITNTRSISSTSLMRGITWAGGCANLDLLTLLCHILHYLHGQHNHHCSYLMTAYTPNAYVPLPGQASCLWSWSIPLHPPHNCQDHLAGCWRAHLLSLLQLNVYYPHIPGLWLCYLTRNELLLLCGYFSSIALFLHYYQK